MCAMIVESLLWMMRNWDCTTMQCIEKPFECSQCGAKGNGAQKFKNHIKRLNVLSAKRALGQNET